MLCPETGCTHTLFPVVSLLCEKCKEGGWCRGRGLPECRELGTGEMAGDCWNIRAEIYERENGAFRSECNGRLDVEMHLQSPIIILS